MKEFKGFISEDGLKIEAKQDVLDYEESLKIPKILKELSKYSFYNDYDCEFQFRNNIETLQHFLTNRYVIELFHLFNETGKSA